MRLLYFNMVVEADATMLKHSWGHASSGQGVGVGGCICSSAQYRTTDQGEQARWAHSMSGLRSHSVEVDVI